MGRPITANNMTSRPRTETLQRKQISLFGQSLQPNTNNNVSSIRKEASCSIVKKKKNEENWWHRKNKLWLCPWLWRCPHASRNSMRISYLLLTTWATASQINLLPLLSTSKCKWIIKKKEKKVCQMFCCAPLRMTGPGHLHQSPTHSHHWDPVSYKLQHCPYSTSRNQKLRKGEKLLLLHTCQSSLGEPLCEQART